MIIDKTFLDNLSDKAKSSERLRFNFDLRNSSEDNSQRMLNALEPGTVLPIHRHRNSSETLVVIRGAVKEQFFNDAGEMTDRWILKPGENTMMQIPAGQWHNLVCLESGTVIYESKDGKYEPACSEDILSV